MSDDIRGLTAQLAADPASLVFLQLGEALRRARRFEAAAKVAQQGLARYPNLPDAHDLYARILVDQGKLETAFDEWDMTLRLDPVHAGAHKGVGYLYFRAGDLPSAEHHLEVASRELLGDDALQSALARVRERLAAEGAEAVAAEAVVEPPAGAPPLTEPEPAPPEAPPAGLDLAPGMLLLDSAGLRLEGRLDQEPPARDDQVAAELAGVSREVSRAVRLLGLGDWQGIAVEAADATFFLAPPTADTLLLVRREREMPMGRLALLATRTAELAQRWLEGGG